MILTKHIRSVILMLLLIAAMTITVSAQPKIFSPYSKTGLGNIQDLNHPSTMSMGGISAAYNDLYIINDANPASLSYLQASSFDVGVNIRYGNLITADNKKSAWGGHLDNFSLAFPLLNPINELLEGTNSKFKYGMGFSLRPYSLVGYNIQSIDSTSSPVKINREYIGDGGLYTVNWGTGVRYNQASLGVSIGYLFGSTNQSRSISFPDLFNAYNDEFQDNIAYSGFVWKAGAQYEAVLKREATKDGIKGKALNVLNIGVHGNLGNSFTTKYDQLYYRINESYTTRDTLVNNFDVEGTGKLPAGLGFGLNYRDQKWMVGGEFKYTAWSDYKNTAKPESFDNSWRSSMGFAYTPDANSFTNYFKRATYRAGAFYHKSEKGYDQYALTFGAGFPFVNQKQYSFINAGFEVGKINDAYGIDELYVRARVSFTINNNLWFLKRKYD